MARVEDPRSPLDSVAQLNPESVRACTRVRLCPRKA